MITEPIIAAQLIFKIMYQSIKNVEKFTKNDESIGYRSILHSPFVHGKEII